MIVAEITEKRICLKGHAGYDEHGKDIVCAAVSILWYSITEKMKKDGIHFRMHEEEGYSELVLRECNKTTETLLDTMRCGLEYLEENYPENIFLKKYKGVDCNSKKSVVMIVP